MGNRLIEKDVNVRGKLVKLFRNCPKPDGWFGGVIRTHGELVGITGSCDIPVTVGMTLNAVVDAYEHSEYGEQYKASSVSVVMTDDASLIAYLSSSRFPGVGRVTAEKIVFEYGPDTLEMIEKQPDVVKNTCKLSDRIISILQSGVSSKSRANRLFAQFPHLTERWASRLAGEVNASDVENGKVADAFRRKHVLLKDIVKNIENNPYFLISEGVPFPIADAIALYDCKWSWDNVVRVNYIFMSELEKFMNRTGATYVNLMNNEDTISLRESLSFILTGNKYDNRVSDVFVKDVMVRLARDRKLVFDVSLRNESHLYDSRMRFMEQCIVSEVMHHLMGGMLGDKFDSVAKSMLKKVSIKFMRDRHAGVFGLAKEQEDAIYFILQNSLSCLCGGPGRGKTFVMKTLAETWKSEVGGDVLMLAPTGKAVGRLKESTNWEQAETIARCLLMQQVRRNDVSSDKVAGHICDVDGLWSIKNSYETLVIIDESSMVDFEEGYAVLELFHDCHIVFVGDSSQLPPIEPGAFFHELITSGVVPVFELKKNHRTESVEISDNADLILTGNTRFNVTNNFTLMPCDDETGVQYILDMYQQYLAAGAEFSDILLMSPVNKGVGSVTDINGRLQELLNPQVVTANLIRDNKACGSYYDAHGWVIPGVEHHGIRCRIGGRVMNTKNHADGPWYKYEYNNPDEKQIDRGYGYFNGDTGQVLRYYFSGVGYDEPYLMILLDDGRVVSIPVSEFREWVIAYCITVHKSQGCEAKHTILMLPSKLTGTWFTNSKFLNQNLLYTAVTRARSTYTMVGNMGACKACVQTPYDYKNTALATYINNRAVPYLVMNNKI